MKPPSNFFSSFKNRMFEKYSQNPGNMLVHTGVLGWVLSSLAQVGAVVFNDKIPPEQKSFLIPQEVGDAFANILSFYLITSSLKKLASKMVSTGKLTTPAIKKFLEKHGCQNEIGKVNFNISKLSPFEEISGKYNSWKNGVDVVASVVGSVISCNLVTPVIRNKYASSRQKVALAKMNNPERIIMTPPKGITINDYQNRAALKFSGNSLKI